MTLNASAAALLSAAVLLLASCSLADPGPAQIEPLRENDASASGPGEKTEIRVVTLLEWLQEPWGMDFLPDGRILLTEKPGVMKLVTPGSWTTRDISGLPPVANEGQGGLLDVLVHPDFARNQWVYFSYSVAIDSGLTTRVSRARLQGDRLVDRQDLFTAKPAYPQRRHFGSRLLLDAGYLYITVGDRGRRAPAQDLLDHSGKVLRLTEHGAIPADNPFVGKPGALAEIYSYGHRNPQGIARHPHSGQIWVAEHGPQGGDEINILKPGANYGWPVITYGEEYGGGKIGEGTHKPGMEQPLIYYTPSLATGGIDFYTRETYPDWQDSLLVSSMKMTRINRLEVAADGSIGRETRLLGNLGMRIRDVQVGPDGLVYALADRSRLIRLEP
ncbi:PQQ-dependent sugar dehydrogenase [Seongchinamella sediminis]|uniref:PQQ-dependent sugar dehydrogenase n=1 Tax=Seongchinamella sediminis TaxID=2283635 RepID=A0A3L7E4S4_9GAMM|nr:PQQ-dependent sugar dehydrogenase [Seongchinamella sediminis]RLQ23512.1 PQQ-dependent sugar dehydrogenase [Seongchinamella sediminis]